MPWKTVVVASVLVRLSSAFDTVDHTH